MLFPGKAIVNSYGFCAVAKTGKRVLKHFKKILYPFTILIYIIFISYWE